MPELDGHPSLEQLAAVQPRLAEGIVALSEALAGPHGARPEALTLAAALLSVVPPDADLLGSDQQSLVDDAGEWFAELAAELQEGAAGVATATALADLGRCLAEACPEVPRLGPAPSTMEIAEARLAEQTQVTLGSIASAVMAGAALATATVPATDTEGSPAAPVESLVGVLNVRFSYHPEIAQIWNEAVAAGRTHRDLTVPKEARKAYNDALKRFLTRLVDDNPVADRAREIFVDGGCKFLRDDAGQLLPRMPVIDLPDVERFRTGSYLDVFRVSGQHLDQIAHAPTRALDPTNLVFMTGRENVLMDTQDSILRLKIVKEQC